MNLKRFLLFAGETYYPSGGWGDFKESFDTEEEATKAGKATIDWFQVIDLENPPKPEDL